MSINLYYYFISFDFSRLFVFSDIGAGGSKTWARLSKVNMKTGMTVVLLKWKGSKVWEIVNSQMGKRKKESQKCEQPLL